MNFNRIRYFQSVATLQSFRRAAEVVGISQPSLSRQIKILEHECGAALFHRVSNRIHLTPTGQLLLDRSASLLAEMEQLKKGISDLQSGERAHLVVGAIQSTLDHPIPAAINIMRKRHPGLHIAVRGSQSIEIIERVSRGHLDVCVVATPVADPRIIVELLAREHYAAVVPATCSLARQAKVKIRDLAAETLITFPKGFGIRDMIDAAALKTGVRLEAVVELESIEAIKALVGYGAGISILPRSATLCSLSRSGVAIVAIDDPILVRDIVAARLASQLNNSLIDQFVDALKHVYAESRVNGATSPSAPAATAASRVLHKVITGASLEP
jgi:DNA-binding transcriptional LysR family regulator